MDADLHFHPSFSSSPTWLERKIPRIEDIAEAAMDNNIGLLTVTSCSNAVHRDKRWEDLMIQIWDLKNQDMVILSSKAIKVSKKVKHPYERDVVIIHGQEFKTDRGDVNVLFAERDIPLRESLSQFPKADFRYLLDAARNYGEHVVIGLNEVMRSSLSDKEIRDLYERGKIDFIESFNSMETWKNNFDSDMLAARLNIPGIAVSDGHRLEDMGASYTIFKSNDLREDPAAMAEAIRNNNFYPVERSCSLQSMALYAARLGNAIAGGQIKKILKR
jgi:hypothetical protein